MSASGFNDFGLSRESAKAKTGVEYLFDGELKGLERLIASAYEDKILVKVRNLWSLPCRTLFLRKPIILDLREPKTRHGFVFIAFIPCMQIMPLVWLLGETCGSVLTKIKCRVKCRYSSASSDPDDEGWVYLGQLNQDPKREAVTKRWSRLTTDLMLAPRDVNDLKQRPDLRGYSSSLL